MNIYAITHRGRVSRMGTLCKLEKRNDLISRLGSNEAQPLIATTRKKAIEKYIYYFGFTWKERTKGVDVVKLK